MSILDLLALSRDNILGCIPVDIVGCIRRYLHSYTRVFAEQGNVIVFPYNEDYLHGTARVYGFDNAVVSTWLYYHGVIIR